MSGLAAIRGDAGIAGEAQVFDLDEARRRRQLRQEEWVKIDQLAKEISYSRSSIYRFVTMGAPVRQLRGGTLRFQVGPFKEWLSATE